MIEASGWFLPESDTYFQKFMVNKPQKQNGFQREHLLEAFKYVKSWEVAVDIGAHVGFWTRDMAQRFQQVHAFEASSDTFACLTLNMAEFDNVTLYNIASGEIHGICSVVEDETRKGNTGSRFIQLGQGDIAVVPLDDFDLSACGLLKIDVEGYELQVLQGAVATIDDYRPVVIMETDKKFALSRYGVPDDAAEKWLLDRGYRYVAHMRPDKIFVHGLK